MGKYFEPTEPCYKATIRANMEKDRVFDVSDAKWGHPVLQDENWVMANTTSVLFDPELSVEEKRKQAKEAAESILKMFGEVVLDGIDIETYKVPGCPEEPDAETEAIVYRPKNLKKKKARCLFYCLGGGLVFPMSAMVPFDYLCEHLNCVIVMPKYRVSYEAQYPAAINDHHAVYKWMIENADMLKINPDNVVLNGSSSGGHLALSLAFRLKRYGYSPKGIVVIGPQTDDRENNLLSHKIYHGGWDAGAQRQALAQWLGHNFGSSQTGPEALANHANVEDCIGYPPTFIHTTEFDPDRDNCREFYGKLLEAKTFTEYHCWAGAPHGGKCYFGGPIVSGEENDYSRMINMIVTNNIGDCFKYDLRRPWVVEEAKGAMNE